MQPVSCVTGRFIVRDRVAVDPGCTGRSWVMVYHGGDLVYREKLLRDSRVNRVVQNPS